jgi:hypothetical protein
LLSRQTPRGRKKRNLQEPGNAYFALRNLEFMVNATFFHDQISNMARFNFAVNWEILISKRAVPDIVITLSSSHKPAAARF